MASIFDDVGRSNDRYIDDMLNHQEVVASGGDPYITGAGVDLRTLVHIARQRLIVERIRRDEARSKRFYRFVHNQPFVDVEFSRSPRPV